MREAGQERLADRRVSWTEELPGCGAFDRVLCGAAIWQLEIAPLAALVAPGGALCFTIPALYLGEGEEPGGGEDPLLVGLYARLAGGRVPQAQAGGPLPDVESELAAAGLRPERWGFRRRITQAELRDWLAIPPLTDALLRELEPDERLHALDEAYEYVDEASWRWERWHGWTAWRSI
jgi:hypothetical protein